MGYIVHRSASAIFILAAAGLATAAALASGCTEEYFVRGIPDETVSGIYGKEDITERKTVTVRFLVSEKTPSTRTESTIWHLEVFLYKDGLFCMELDSSLEADIIPGEKYTYYALANNSISGGAPLHEEDILEYIVDVNPGEPELFTMSACGEFSVTEDNPTVAISLERLHSIIRFSIDDSEAKGLEVSSVNIRQAATSVSLFRTSEASETNGGEAASASELDALNNGEEIVFYVPENCQGVLLPDNSDSWAKVPDNIGLKSKLCTYMEVKGKFSGEYELGGKVTYRFYLGQDVTSDFNIFRNTEYHVCLCPTRKDINRPSWMVSAQVYADIPYIMVDNKGNIFYDCHSKVSTSKHSAEWTKVIKGKDGYLATGNDDGGVIGFSSDMENWEFTKISTYEILDVVYGNGKYLLACSDDCIRVSEDARRWSAYRIGPVNSLDVAGNLFIAMGDNTIYSSDDGISWSSYNAGNKVSNAAYGDGEFLVTGNTGFVYKSADGMEWTPCPVDRNMPESVELVYGNGVYVLSSGKGMHYSYDGIQWIQIQPYTMAYAAMDFYDGIFLAACLRSTIQEIYTSLDGIVWKQLKLLADIAYGKPTDICIAM